MLFSEDCRVRRTRHTLACCLVFIAAFFTHTSKLPWQLERRCRGVDSAGPVVARFAPLSDCYPAGTVLGYTTDLKLADDPTTYLLDFYIARFSIYPLNLEFGIDRDLVLACYYERYLPHPPPPGFTLDKHIGDVFVYRRRASP